MLSKKPEAPQAVLNVLNFGEEDWDSFDAPELPFHRYPINPVAYHYACPKCGVEWAFWQPLTGGKAHHQFIHKPCLPCGGNGSLRMFETFPLQFLPRGALLREIEILIHNPENYYAIEK